MFKISIWFLLSRTGIPVRTGFYLCSFRSGQQEPDFSKYQSGSCYPEPEFWFRFLFRLDNPVPVVP